MKMKLMASVFAAATILMMVGCSSEPAKATAEETKNFQGGPPPANYMDKANAATSAAQSKPDDKPKTP